MPRRPKKGYRQVDEDSDPRAVIDGSASCLGVVGVFLGLAVLASITMSIVALVFSISVQDDVSHIQESAQRSSVSPMRTMASVRGKPSQVIAIPDGGTIIAPGLIEYPTKQVTRDGHACTTRIAMLYAADFFNHSSENRLDETRAETSSCGKPFGDTKYWREGFDFTLDAGGDMLVSPEYFTTAVEHSINVWTRHLPIELVRSQTMTGGCCEISEGIGIGDSVNCITGNVVINKPGVLAAAWIRMLDTGEIVEVDIGFNLNADLCNADDNRNCYDIMHTAVHEFGHLLGLDHTPYPGATMEPTVSRGTTDGRIPLDCEFSTLCDLYGVTMPSCFRSHPTIGDLTPTFCSMSGDIIDSDPSDNVPPEIIYPDPNSATRCAGSVLVATVVAGVSVAA